MSQTSRDQILTWFNAGLAAVNPFTVTRDVLGRLEIGEGRLIVLSVGKASDAMATAAQDVLGDRIDAGVVIAKQGQLESDVFGFQMLEAAHPIPDQSSLLAGETVLDIVDGLTANDTVIALISGGGSSLLEYPADGISLMDMQVTTELLMYAGAGIHDLNTVRKALSAIKGGGLRRSIGDARCITLMLSDVVGNDHSVIASGPTVPGPTNRGAAWQVIEDFRIQDQVPDSVRLLLTEDAPPTPEIDISRDVREIIADNSTIVEAVKHAAERDEFRVIESISHWCDDVSELATRILEDCRSADDDVDVIIGGGEATSIVRGSGRGGRNTEAALNVALTMTAEDDWTVASLASDGDDGNSGAAGAIVHSAMIDDVDAANAALAESNSASYLEEKNALIVTGPTGTNVNDVYIAVRNHAVSGESK